MDRFESVAQRIDRSMHRDLVIAVATPVALGAALGVLMWSWSSFGGPGRAHSFEPTLAIGGAPGDDADDDRDDEEDENDDDEPPLAATGRCEEGAAARAQAAAAKAQALADRVAAQAERSADEAERLADEAERLADEAERLADCDDETSDDET
jgi:hypothetical protein